MTLELAKSQVKRGWWSLLDKAFEIADGQIVDVKEKFGALRIETVGVFEDIDEIEEMSRTMCEICGDVGKTIQTSTGWYKTLCERHING
jgi:hypothetical protein